MQKDGQTYFDLLEKIPEEDKKRLKEYIVKEEEDIKRTERLLDILEEEQADK